MFTPQDFYQKLLKLRRKLKEPALNDDAKKFLFAKQKLELADRTSSTILSILYNRALCKQYLVELNNKILDNVKDQSLFFPPTEYLEEMGLDYPLCKNEVDPAEKSYLNAFESILLQTEQEHGINIGRTVENVVDFFGLIPNLAADAVIINDEIWNDSIMDLENFVHGRYSHRIQLYIILRAFDDKKIDLSLLNGCQNLFNNVNFLKYLLTDYSFEGDRNHWLLTLDTNLFQWNSVYQALHDKAYGALTSPSGITTFILSSEGFKDMPGLARAVFFNYNSTCNYYAKALNVKPEDFFREFFVSLKLKQTSKSLAVARSIYFMQCQQDEAYTGFAKKAGIFHFNKPLPRSCYDKGVASFKKENFKEAIGHFKGALMLYNQQNNDDQKDEKAIVCYNLGSTYNRLENTRVAVSYYQQCLELRKHLPENNPKKQKVKEALNACQKKII